MKHASIIACLFVLAGVATVACSTADGQKSAADTSTPVSQTPSTPTPPTPDPQDSKKKMQDVAVLETNLGEIEIAFLPDKAPGHVKNFQTLAKKGFYDGTKFHRVIPGFMIQGGDPNSKDKDRSNDGMGGPGFNIKAEFNDVSHVRGIVSMARSNDPDSAGSQFFIVVKDSTFLDNKYTVFGKVVKGMDIADKIVNLAKDGNDNPLDANPAIIKSIKIVQKEV
jgi:peptidyl-prolyl cis-trans isomerase B (cyclophilin B)